MIDKIITPTSDVSTLNLTLNDMINKESNKIYYKNKNGNQIIIFTTPIFINSIFDESLSEPMPRLFDTSSNEYQIIVPVSQVNEYGKEGFVEGLTKTAYCQPIDMIDPSISKTADLSIPLVGKYTPNNATNNIMRTAINFMAFVLVLGFTYNIAPIVYNDFVVGLIAFQGQQKMNRLRAIDIYICFVFILVSIGLINRGIKENNANSTLMGFFVGLFFIISMVVIQSTKMRGDWLIDNFKVDGNEAMINSLYTKVSPDIFGFIMENGSLFLSKIFLGILIFLIFMGFLYLIGSFNKNGIMNTYEGYIYLTLLTIYITIATSTLRNDDE
jgi:hypothetical protein